jgi:hypothetical protein
MLTSQTANRLCRDRLENLQVEISVEKAAPPFTGWMWPWRERVTADTVKWIL